jgi:soluble lytic murein transglycosylase
MVARMRQTTRGGGGRPPFLRRHAAALTLAAVALAGAVLAALAGAVPEPRAAETLLRRPLQLPTPEAGVVLRPTVHETRPASLEAAWLVPGPTELAQVGALRDFAAGIRHYSDANYALALEAMSLPGLQRTPLAAHAAYYQALCRLRLTQPGEARAMLSSLRAAGLEGTLAEAVPLAEAEAAVALGDPAAAVVLLDALAQQPVSAPHVVRERLAAALRAAGDEPRAQAILLELYREDPTSPNAEGVTLEVSRIREAAGPDRAAEFLEADLRRAERLFAARQHDKAFWVFAQVRPLLSGDRADLVELRLAQCEYHQGRPRQAWLRLEPLWNRTALDTEVRYYGVLSLRDLGRTDDFVTQARQLAEAFPDTTWAEDALNALATHYIRVSDDASATEVFQTIVERYPSGRHTQRAAWKLGWSLFRAGGDAEAAAVFETASFNFPRSDYRPAWLYWAARAHDRLGQTAAANARFSLVTVDYLHTYYGRLAARLLETRGITPGRLAEVPPDSGARSTVEAALSAPPVAASVPSPARGIVGALVAAGLLDLARDEVRAFRLRAGPAAALDATDAWILARQGDLRAGITGMRRAYPQHLTAEGDELPEAIRRVIYPLEYWDLLRRHARAHGLDPHLVAALVAQESTFDAGVRSAANAYGLMQIIPGTGRRLARLEGIRRFRTSMLTRPEVNVRLGTRYLSNLLERFDGAAHFALASYNAGEARVDKWRAEKPGLEQDEFIDDIPFPETQNYVKRILGTAEEYRRLYPLSRGTAAAPAASGGDGPASPGGVAPGAAKTSASPTKAPTSSVSQKKTPAKKAPAKKAPAKKTPPKKTAPN